MFRDCPVSRSDVSHVDQLKLTWTDTGVRWYNTTHAQMQNNDAGRTYYYCAIGYEKKSA